MFVLILGYNLYTVVTTSRRTLGEDEIWTLLNEDGENEEDLSLGSDSEIEDLLSQDNVQSDYEDEFVDTGRRIACCIQ